VVERVLPERERQRITLYQAGCYPGSLQMSAGELELLLLDVHADEADAREFLPEDRQDGAHSAAHLEHTCPRLELRAVADQPVSPVLSLLDEPMLLACSIAVNVVGDASRLGSVLAAGSRVARSG
jgi:hypothetical protein